MGRMIRMTDVLRLVRPTHALLGAVGLTVACALAAPALAQNDKMTPIAISAQPNAIDLGTGPLPEATVPDPGTANTAAFLRATSRSPRSRPSCRIRPRRPARR